MNSEKTTPDLSEQALPTNFSTSSHSNFVASARTGRIPCVYVYLLISLSYRYLCWQAIVCKEAFMKEGRKKKKEGQSALWQ